MDDDEEIYDGIRAQFPLAFGKQSKPVTSLEAVHNATRRSTANPTTAAATATNEQSSSTNGNNSKGFPSLSSSSKAWLESLKNPNSSSSSRSNPNPNPSRASDEDGAMVGPPPPSLGSDWANGGEDESVMIGPPRPPAFHDEDDDDDQMIGPPPPPPGSISDDSDAVDSDNEDEGRYRIPLSNEIILKGHTKVLFSTYY